MIRGEVNDLKFRNCFFSWNGLSDDGQLDDTIQLIPHPGNLFWREKKEQNDVIKKSFFLFVKFNILESQNKSGKAGGCMEDGQAYPRQTIVLV